MNTIKKYSFYISILIISISFSNCTSDSGDIRISDIQFINTTHEIYLGRTLLLKTEFYPNNESAPITWSSSNNDIAEVDTQGLVTTKKLGTCIITASIYNDVLKAPFEITVIPIGAENISLKEKSLSLFLGDEKEIEYEIVPQSSTITEVILSSSNENVIEIVDNKKVLAVGTGRTSITVSIKNTTIKDSCMIEVIPIPVESITIVDSSHEMLLDDTLQLTCTVTPQNADAKNIIYTSSDKTVLTVDKNGLVTSKKLGTAEIIVTSLDGSSETKCMIKVISITDYISLNKYEPSLISIDGYFTGTHSAIIINNSTQDIYLTKYELIDSETGLVKNYKENIGILKAGEQLDLGENEITNIYKPVDKWYFTYKDKNYTLQKKWE